MEGFFKRLPLFVRVLVFVGCTGMVAGGCSTMTTCTVVCQDAMIKQGRQAFLDKDYTLARQIFSQLSMTQDDPQLEAAGLYGNICLDMLLAENAPAYRKAVEQFLLLPSQLPCKGAIYGEPSWDCRKKLFNTGFGVHPRMLEKALAHGMVLLENERADILKKLNTLYARQKVYKHERLSMKKKIDALGPEVRTLEKQNRAQQERITDLLHQITVLEKIDKERQEQRENQ